MIIDDRIMIWRLGKNKYNLLKTEYYPQVAVSSNACENVLECQSSSIINILKWRIYNVRADAFFMEKTKSFGKEEQVLDHYYPGD